MTVSQLARLSAWHDRHRSRHPVEGRVWDAVRTAWLVGAVGAPVAVLLDRPVAAAAAGALFCAPAAYRAARGALHRRGRLRCDWLNRG